MVVIVGGVESPVAATYAIVVAAGCEGRSNDTMTCCTFTAAVASRNAPLRIGAIRPEDEGAEAKTMSYCGKIGDQG